MLKIAGAIALSLLVSTSVYAGDKKKVYARYLPVQQLENLYGGLPLSHTYACEENDDKERCYSRSGRAKDGKKLGSTSSKEKNTNVKCVHSEGKSGGACDMHLERNFWSRDGLCHQETNHGIRTGAKGGPKVKEASGYYWSKLRYGDYGKAGTTVEATCKAACGK